MFGISKQAYYKRLKVQDKVDMETSIILTLVKEKRMLMPRLGGKKLYHMLKVDFENIGIKLGRDKFFDMLRENRMLVKRRKNYITTTNSHHRFRKYPNLIKELEINRPEQVWVADITYIKTNNGHTYLSLITDAYSKQIVGMHLSDNLKTTGPLEALKMAIKNRLYPDKPLIHHSDRGFQYCNPEYTNMLESSGIDVSMTQSYDPYENAVAERVNGILKCEFEIGSGFRDLSQADKEIIKSIAVYNNIRPHMSCGLLTPNEAHKNPGYQLKRWGSSKVANNSQLLTKKKEAKKKIYDNI